jgi:integrase
MEHAGRVNDGQQGLNRALVGLFVHHMQERNRRPSTVYTYETFLVYHFLPWLGDRALDAVSLSDLESFIGRTREWSRTEGAAATRRRETSMLRTTLGWLFRRGLIDKNSAAALEGPSLPKRKPRAVPDALWITTWRLDMPIATLVAIGLAFYGGLRRTEVVKLRAAQIDLRQLEIVNFERKGGGEDVLPIGMLLHALAEGFTRRRLPQIAFTDEFVKALRDLLASRQPEQPLMPWGDRCPAPPAAVHRHGLDADMGDPQHFTKAVSGLGKRVGYTLGPHALRHSFVTNLLRAGVRVETVSAMANHASLATTSTYIRSGKAELAEQLATMTRVVDDTWMAGPRHRRG